MGAVGKITVDFEGRTSGFNSAVKDAQGNLSKFNQKAKEGDSGGFFKSLGQSLKAQAKEERQNGTKQLERLANGKLPGVLGFGVEVAEKFVDRIAEVKEQFQAGEISAGGMVVSLAESLPVVGSLVTLGKKVVGLFDNSEALHKSQEAARAFRQELAKIDNEAKGIGVKGFASLKIQAEGDRLNADDKIEGFVAKVRKSGVSRGEGDREIQEYIDRTYSLLRDKSKEREKEYTEEIAEIARQGFHRIDAARNENDVTKLKQGGNDRAAELAENAERYRQEVEKSQEESDKLQKAHPEVAKEIQNQTNQYKEQLKVKKDLADSSKIDLQLSSLRKQVALAGLNEQQKAAKEAADNGGDHKQQLEASALAAQLAAAEIDHLADEEQKYAGTDAIEKQRMRYLDLGKTVDQTTSLVKKLEAAEIVNLAKANADAARDAGLSEVEKLEAQLQRLHANADEIRQQTGNKQLAEDKSAAAQNAEAMLSPLEKYQQTLENIKRKESTGAYRDTYTTDSQGNKSLLMSGAEQAKRERQRATEELANAVPKLPENAGAAVTRRFDFKIPNANRDPMLSVPEILKAAKEADAQWQARMLQYARSADERSTEVADFTGN